MSLQPQAGESLPLHPVTPGFVLGYSELQQPKCLPQGTNALERSANRDTSETTLRHEVSLVKLFSHDALHFSMWNKLAQQITRLFYSKWHRALVVIIIDSALLTLITNMLQCWEMWLPFKTIFTLLYDYLGNATIIMIIKDNNHLWLSISYLSNHTLHQTRRNTSTVTLLYVPMDLHYDLNNITDL